jgi:hypothetical protein
VFAVVGPSSVRTSFSRASALDPSGGEMNRLRIVLGIAFAAVLGVPVSAAAAVPSAPAPVAGKDSAHACARLPVSERGVCASRNAPSQPPALTAAQRTALRSENARYRVAAAACHNLPVSERGICLNEKTLKLEAIAEKG